MTQYDVVGSAYNDISETIPIRSMELHNVQLALQRLLRPKMNIIDFACGSGFYSSRLLSWGADTLTGVDISPVMLSAASSRLSSQVSSCQARFVLGDGTQPRSFAPDSSTGYFDMAFGAWFLNYAQSKRHLTAMFTNIALNLKPDGIFVGIVPHPTDSINQRAEMYRNVPLNKLWPRNEYVKELENDDGWELRVSLDDCGTSFTTWHLRKQVYEEAARLGGLTGSLEWRREELVGEEWKKSCGLTEDEWKVREDNPHFGILVVQKS